MLEHKRSMTCRAQKKHASGSHGLNLQVTQWPQLIPSALHLLPSPTQATWNMESQLYTVLGNHMMNKSQEIQTFLSVRPTRARDSDHAYCMNVTFALWLEGFILGHTHHMEIKEKPGSDFFLKTIILFDFTTLCQYI